MIPKEGGGMGLVTIENEKEDKREGENFHTPHAISLNETILIRGGGGVEKKKSTSSKKRRTVEKENKPYSTKICIPT